TRCLDMAREFPHVEVLGIDLQPGPTEGIPSNCAFAIHDIDKGLSPFHGLFDLLKDHQATLKNSIACLKPDGIVIFMDPVHMLKEDGSVHLVLFRYRSSMRITARSPCPRTGTWRENKMTVQINNSTSRLPRSRILFVSPRDGANTLETLA
ncbi:9865_t:CDS:2, partial [Acaulospora colombiana]